jgi:hypothetical protein
MTTEDEDPPRCEDSSDLFEYLQTTRMIDKIDTIIREEHKIEPAGREP